MMKEDGNVIHFSNPKGKGFAACELRCLCIRRPATRFLLDFECGYASRNSAITFVRCSLDTGSMCTR